MSQLRVYDVYGLTVASDLPFRTPLPPGSNAPEIYLQRSGEPIALPDSSPIYRSPNLTAGGRPVLTIHRQGATDTLVMADDTRFRIEGGRIDVHGSRGVGALAEIFILGTLLTYLLEHRGIPVLHASTVEVDGRAVSFLAGNGGGKSSLAAGLMQAGYPLISDDLLPITGRGGDYTAQPGYPQMRFWPDQAQYFADDVGSLERVHPDLEKLRVPVGPGGFGEIAGRAAPLAVIYIPERYAAGDSDGLVKVTPVPAREAVVALSRELFLRPVLEKLGLMGPRLAFLAGLAGKVPVRRLCYPSGMEHLPSVVAAIRGDVASSA